jgi:hypothetical protein
MTGVGVNERTDYRRTGLRARSFTAFWMTRAVAFWMTILELSLMTYANSGVAEQEVEALWSHPEKFSSLQGQFTQYKTIDILPRPLRSTGHFVYESQGRLSWFVTSPVKSHIELYANRLVQFQADQQVVELTADQYPFVRVMSDIFFGILSGELPHKHF